MSSTNTQLYMGLLLRYKTFMFYPKLNFDGSRIASACMANCKWCKTKKGTGTGIHIGVSGFSSSFKVCTSLQLYSLQVICSLLDSLHCTISFSKMNTEIFGLTVLALCALGFFSTCIIHVLCFSTHKEIQE